MHTPTVLLVGDFGTDIYHVVKARSLSAEAPIPVFDQLSQLELPGMAGNVQANLEAFGVEVETLQSRVDSVPLKHRLVTVKGLQLTRWDEEDWCEPIDLRDLPSPEELADWGVQAVVVADYQKGSIDQDAREVIFGYAASGIPLFVDTKGNPSDWFLGEGVEEIVFFPNEAEFQKYPREYSLAPQILLKLGEEGIEWREYGETEDALPSYADEVLCVNGAGDTVIAAFVSALLKGYGLPRALQFASAAAGTVVGQPFSHRTVDSPLFV